MYKCLEMASTGTAEDYLNTLQKLIGTYKAAPVAAAAPAPAPVAAPAPAPVAAPAPDVNDYLANLQKMFSNTSVSKEPPVNVPVVAPTPAPAPPVPPASPATTVLDVNDYLASLQNILIKPSQTPVPVESYTGRKLKFLLVSTHCQQVTGYSKVSYNLIQQLATIPWLQLYHYGFQKLINKPADMARAYPPNVEVIDAVALEKPLVQGFGYAQLPAEIDRIKPDVVMIYNDMAVITQFMEAIKRSNIRRDFKTWFYVDQVYNCQLSMFLDVINREADRVFTFTQAWRDCLKGQGIHRPIDVLGHGFDEKMFSPMSKAVARRRLNLPDDLFLMLSINRNQPRKRYDLLIMAFVELLVKYPNKPIALMCVCDKGERGGWPLFEIFARELKMRGVAPEQFGNRLMVTNRDMDFKDEEINTFYNAADVSVSAADGEGFGLCTFESMGVGCPQVVPALGGYKEYCNAENSVLVKPTVRYYMPLLFCPVGGEAEAVDPHNLCLGMEEYLNDSELRAKHSAAARNTVLKYTWTSVVETLVKRLKGAHDELN